MKGVSYLAGLTLVPMCVVGCAEEPSDDGVRERVTSEPSSSFALFGERMPAIEAVAESRAVEPGGEFRHSPEVLLASSASSGTGLTARYFDRVDLTGLKLTRIDPNVSFDWDMGAPHASLPADQFSARWTGKVLPAFDELYTFYTSSDDGVRLWVDGLLIIDNWTDHAEHQDFGTVQLKAGKPVDIVLEFYENGGRALSTLSWSSPRQPFEIIPSSQLFPESNAQADEPREFAPNRAYGTHIINVPAVANWVSSGLYLEAGQSVTLNAYGSWIGDGKTSAGPTGPEGRTPALTERGCTVGSLTARLDLGYEESIFCVGSSATIVAPRSGILYLGAVVGTDLDDSYEARYDNSGTMSVVVSSDDGRTVPSVRMADIGSYDFSGVLSGFVELWSRHLIVTAPTEIVRADQTTAAASLDFLDRAYDQHALLRGTTPFRGQRVRVIQDPVMEGNGWYMLAGNPIRSVRDAFLGTPGNGHLLRSSDSAYSVWGILHELGHDFAHAQGPWWYQVGTLEGWPNIFTVHTLRALGRPETVCNEDPTCPSSIWCAGRAIYMASGSYEQFTQDPSLYLCFLLEQEERYGASLYPRFFQRLNGLAGSQVEGSWRWVRDQFNAITGVDTTPSFTAWKLPIE